VVDLLGVSAAGVGACYFVGLRSGGTTSGGWVLMGGFIVVGTAAALMYSIVSPLPDQLDSRHGMAGGFDGGRDFNGDFGGGDSGG
jgi:hypothetical protein